MIEKLNWDSNFFGFEVGKYTIENQFFNESEFVENSKNFILVYLFSKDELKTSNNIKLYDIKTLLEKKISIDVIDNQSIVEYDKSKHNYTEIETLTYLSGKYSRFKIDPNFKNNEFKKMYKIWINDSLNYINAFSVLIKIIDEKIAGFVTIKKINEKISQIGLIAVSESFQGRGIASELIKQAECVSLKKGFVHLQVPTQYTNEPAMKLYYKNGFEVIEKTYIYHYWNI